ncbi:MAG: o-succinylbenzoate synthase [Polyangiaceae bacterium]
MTLRLAVARRRRSLERGFGNASASWAERESLYVTLEDDSGRAGRGEAAPLPGYSPDSLDDAERGLATLAGRLAQVEESCSQIEREPRTLWQELARLPALDAPSARFALQSALLSLLAARRGQAEHTLLAESLGVTPPAIGLALAQLVDIANAEAEAEQALDAGFSTLKLKIGTSLGFERELAALRRLRERWGNAFALRLDANRSLSKERADAWLTALQPLEPEFVEEPLALGEEPLENPKLALGLDESLRELAPEALTARSGQVLVLKPTILGGLDVTLRFVERARELRLGWVLSHTFETGPGYRALLELALGLGRAPNAHGLGPHVALDLDASALGVRAGRLWPSSRRA